MYGISKGENKNNEMVGKKRCQHFIRNNYLFNSCVNNNDKLTWKYLQISVDDRLYVNLMLAIYMISRIFDVGTLKWSSNKIFKLTYSTPHKFGVFNEYMTRNIFNFCQASTVYFFKCKVCTHLYLHKIISYKNKTFTYIVFITFCNI